MEIISRTDELRKRIARILSASSGRRVAIVAFIGKDVARFVADFQGLEVYCWPNKTATNPDGVRHLLNHGAKVYFVDRLHMKAYWSERSGYLIGSPNLSANALDDTVTGLHEIGCFSPNSEELDIDALVKRMHKAGAYPVDEKALWKLERDYEPPFAVTNDSNQSIPSFDEYLGLPHIKPFYCVSWAKKEAHPPAAVASAKEHYEEATGRPSRAKSIITDSIDVSQGKKDGTWILTCRLKSNNSIGKLSWLYCHHVTRVRTNARYETALQIAGLHIPGVPFDLKTSDFESRFTQYAETSLDVQFDQMFNVKAFNKFERSMPT